MEHNLSNSSLLTQISITFWIHSLRMTLSSSSFLRTSLLSTNYLNLTLIIKFSSNSFTFYITCTHAHTHKTLTFKILIYNVFTFLKHALNPSTIMVKFWLCQLFQVSPNKLSSLICLYTSILLLLIHFLIIYVLQQCMTFQHNSINYNSRFFPFLSPISF